MNIPDIISSEEQLDTFLAEPYPETVKMMRNLKGDIMILGVAGKMGPSLARLASNATNEAGIDRSIFGVSRFSNSGVQDQLESWGVETIQCDLANYGELAALPDAENVIFMAGKKFGSVGSEPETWLLNTLVPGYVAKRFQKSRIVVFSTGCVYDLVSRETGGSKESDPPGPIGEYANSCLGRERIFEYLSGQSNTPGLLFRLNYAIDLRYGVLLDIAQSVYENREIDITVDDVNIIWQGDANNRALLSLAHTSVPPAVLNVTGPEIISVTKVAREFGRIFNKDVRLSGTPINRSYLSNASQSIRLFGEPRISVDRMVHWTAEWIRCGGYVYGKPTMFQITDGNYLQ